MRPSITCETQRTNSNKRYILPAKVLTRRMRVTFERPNQRRLAVESIAEGLPGERRFQVPPAPIPLLCLSAARCHRDTRREQQLGRVEMHVVVVFEHL